MIDIHCHLLPGLDDGAGSLDESLAMCRQAVADGIHTIVATPHTLDGLHLNPISRVIEEVARLQGILTENDIPIRVLAGADVHLNKNLWSFVESGEAGTIDNQMKYLLLELPSQSIPSQLQEEIFNLRLRGITPIITHPERNAVVQRDTSILYEVVRLGGLCQVTAMSLTGRFGSAVRECARGLLLSRLAHVIASDGHSADKRPPVLSPAVEVAGRLLASAEEAEHLVKQVPEMILAGEAMEAEEPLRPKRSRFFGLLR
jgi:protein-tyrosine phosphatase